MRTALGKGLEALIPSAPKETGSRSEIQLIPIDKIHTNPYQPRRRFDNNALEALSQSIRERGVLQPILVSRTDDGSYILIAGERRWRAAQQAGLGEIPAVVRTSSDIERFELSLIENLQRENLDPLEEAHGFKRLLEEFHLTQEQVAQGVRKDRSVIANALRLLNLPEDMQHALQEGRISAGHARNLASLEDPTAQRDLFEKILKEQLTVRDVEAAVRRSKQRHARKRARHPEAKPPEIKALEEDLQRTLARKVEFQIAGSDATRGWLRLEFYSLEDLDRLIAQLKKTV